MTFIVVMVTLRGSINTLNGEEEGVASYDDVIRNLRKNGVHRLVIKSLSFSDKWMNGVLDHDSAL